MWIILFNAVDESGILEGNGRDRGCPGALDSAAAAMLDGSAIAYQTQRQVDDILTKVFSECVNGALRIAGLAGVLTKSNYLVSPSRLLSCCIY